MSENSWLRCTDPQEMLSLVEANGGASDRQFRLAACAYCRSVWRFLGKASQRAVLLGEQMADEPVEEGHRAAVVRAAIEAVCRYEEAGGDHFMAADMAYRVPHKDGWYAAEWTLGNWTDLPAGVPILRDIFGPYFRLRPALDVSVLTWNDGLARRLAEEAYNHCVMPAGTLDPDRLAVLSDALEECSADAALVAHLRESGPHWRGCHALDAILGRS